MRKLIAIVGNSGVGKTTLVKALSRNHRFNIGLERHADRPFQARFKADRRFALANQVDFLLLRAEQEQEIRQGTRTGLLDGGFDMDFHVFTRLFLQKGYLSAQEFSLCERLYQQIRNTQPPPEMIIWMQAPIKVVAARFAMRDRPLEIAQQKDLKIIDSLLQEWLDPLEPKGLIRLDASGDDPAYRQQLPDLWEQLRDAG